MTKLTSTLTVLFFFIAVQGQSFQLDSMKRLFNSSNDTSEVLTLLRVSSEYFNSKPDTAFLYAQQAANLSQKLNFKLGEGQANNIIANIFYSTGNYGKALETQFSLVKIWQSVNDTFDIAASYNTIALVYSDQADYRKALPYYFKAEKIFKALGYDEYVVTVLLNVGDNYQRMGELDSALIFEKKAYELAKTIHDSDDMGMILTNLGNIQFELGMNNAAFKYYRSAITNAMKSDDLPAVSEAQYGIAKIYQIGKQTDSAIVYAKYSLFTAVESSDSKRLDSVSTLLSDLFESKNQIDSALFYYKKAVSEKSALVNAQTVKKVQVMSTVEQLRQMIETEKAYRDKIRVYILIGGLIAVLLVAFFLFRSNREKNKSNKKIEQAYTELKSTQSQLIQSEKMASLGELTAGIAHEIQNPLNFVNNFSEVNNELISELEQEAINGNIDEVQAIAKDLKENEEKINHHGKRADAIVKAMLQHSRQSQGIKEPTDINVVCDEYLRLSYHGMRAKDKDFNSDFKTEFRQS